MATKPRYEKTPIQLWIADNRRKHGLTTLDLADLAGVREATARSWESRGKPSEEALAVLERRFGEKAPPEPVGYSVELHGAIADLTATLRELVAEIREDRERGADASTALLQAVKALRSRPTPPGYPASTERPVPDGSRG